MADEEESEDIDSNEEQEPEEVPEEEVVEEIEEETSGGLLGSFSSEALLAGGVIFGIALGLITGYGLASTSSGVQKVSPEEVQSTVSQLVGENADVGTPEVQNGLYRLTIESQREVTNQTTNETTMQTATQEVYATLDNEKLFAQYQGSFYVLTDVQTALNNLNNQQPAQGTGNQTSGNQTTGNQTS